jgi:transposase
MPSTNIDPHAWLADVLARLQDHPAKRIDELLPWNWKRERLQKAAASRDRCRARDEHCD